MRTYTCQCGNTLYFENTKCLQCGHDLGFDPELLSMISLEELSDGQLTDVKNPGSKYKKCENYRIANVCNWLLKHDEDEEYCLACRLNTIIPDLSKNENRPRWLKLEKAKRRLIYTLVGLHLPVSSEKVNPGHGLAFRFMENIQEYDPYKDEVVTYEQIMTGHDAGVITINIMEADDSTREKIRESMNESYRTLLGHFRHEVGHYYWDMYIARSDLLQSYRDLFGDERIDYPAALKNYYEQGPKPDWMNNYISPYASAHPWEDWAETWAHYLHCIDLLETANHHNVGIGGEDFKEYHGDLHQWLKHQDFTQIINRLVCLMHTLNEMNRSLGLSDPYTFELTPRVIEKLSFIHNLIMLQAH